jgi:hypothetical protein
MIEFVSDPSGIHEEIESFAQERFAGLVQELAVDAMEPGRLFRDNEAAKHAYVESFVGQEERETWYEFDDGRQASVMSEVAITTDEEPFALGRYSVMLVTPWEPADGHFISHYEKFAIDVINQDTMPSYESGITVKDASGEMVPDEAMLAIQRAVDLMEQDLITPTDEFVDAADAIAGAEATERAMGDTTFTYARYGEVMKLLRSLAPEHRMPNPHW